MTLSVQTVRGLGTIDGINRYTGLPFIHSPSPGAFANIAIVGDQYPSSRAVNYARLASDPSPFYRRTWIARMGGDTTAENIPNALSMTFGPSGGSVEATICDPDLVDWTSITRTGRRPRNRQLGRVRYEYLVYTAELKDGPTVLTSADAYETRCMARYQNTTVEVRKLSPFVYDTDIDNLGYRAAWSSGGLNDYNNATLLRLVNGTADVTYSRGSLLIDNPNAVDSTDIFVAPVVEVSPGVWEADFTTASNKGTVNASSTLEIFQADLTAAGITRWGFYFLWMDPLIGGGVNYKAYAPVDIPPLYDCPGVDGMLMGGFYS